MALATPYMLACLRWQVPKASLTYTSPSLARPATKSSWVFCCSGVSFLSGFFLALSGMVSPAWKRTFSSSTTSPAFMRGHQRLGRRADDLVGAELDRLAQQLAQALGAGLRLPSGS